MGNKASFMLQDEEINLIRQETGFSPAQIERLYSRFTRLDKGGNGSLSRQDCLAIPELAINPLCDRIVHMFFIDCDEDHDRINFRQFMKVLATFRSSHKSPPSRSRNVSRQESLNHQQQQSMMKQAPLLFDSIDPSPFSTTFSRHHARRSSFQDGFIHDLNQHHLTNQHSFHYAASLSHLPTPMNLHSYHHQQNYNQFHSSTGGNHEANITNVNVPIFKKPFSLPLVDPDEPPNSLKQKLHFMFKVYDVNNDNLIDLKDLISILKMMVGTYVDEARVRKIAERSLRESDKNCDGFISFDEFCATFAHKDVDEALKIKFSSLS